MLFYNSLQTHTIDLCICTNGRLLYSMSQYNCFSNTMYPGTLTFCFHLQSFCTRRSHKIFVRSATSYTILFYLIYLHSLGWKVKLLSNPDHSLYILYIFLDFLSSNVHKPNPRAGILEQTIWGLGAE